MVWVRLTDAGGGFALLEIRPVYMRLSTELSLDLVDVLARISPYLFPARIEVYGETRSGGFGSAYVVDPYGWAGTPLDLEEQLRKNVSLIGEVVYTVMERRSVGHVRGDGVVRHLSDRVLRIYATLKPLHPRLRGVSARLLFKHIWLLENHVRYLRQASRAVVSTKLEDAIIVEGSKEQIEFITRLIQRPVYPSPHFTILTIEHRSKRAPQHCAESGNDPSIGILVEHDRVGGNEAYLLIKNLQGVKIRPTLGIGRNYSGFTEIIVELDDRIKALLDSV